MSRQSVNGSIFSFKAVQIWNGVLRGRTQKINAVLEGEKRWINTETDLARQSTVIVRGAWQTGPGTSAPIPPCPCAFWAFPWSYKTA